MKAMFPTILSSALLMTCMPACATDDSASTCLEDLGEDAPPWLEEAECESFASDLDKEKADSYWGIFYESSYMNLIVSGESELGDVALIAGSHSKDFPFYGDIPWDNGLLLVGDEGYMFTHRQQGQALDIEVDLDSRSAKGRISYDGTMIRESDGADVKMKIDLPVTFDRYQPRQLGKQYNLFDLDGVVGLRWQPFEIGEAGPEPASITIGLETTAVENMNGELEYGKLNNLQTPKFGFHYDYVALAQPGREGYAFVDFASHAINPTGIGKVLEWYLSITASETVTLQSGDISGNPNGVERPAQSEARVVLFENSVDLELATLRRQMIKTTDAKGKPLYGLREIFEVK
jgi:hypothetical protein